MSCFFGHKWGMWMRATEKTRIVHKGKEYPSVNEYQVRVCDKCGRMQKEDL